MPLQPVAERRNAIIRRNAGVGLLTFEYAPFPQEGEETTCTSPAVRGARSFDQPAALAGDRTMAVVIGISLDMERADLCPAKPG